MGSVHDRSFLPLPDVVAPEFEIEMQETPSKDRSVQRQLSSNLYGCHTVQEKTHTASGSDVKPRYIFAAYLLLAAAIYAASAFTFTSSWNTPPGLPIKAIGLTAATALTGGAILSLKKGMGRNLRLDNQNSRANLFLKILFVAIALASITASIHYSGGLSNVKDLFSRIHDAHPSIFPTIGLVTAAAVSGGILVARKRNKRLKQHKQLNRFIQDVRKEEGIPTPEPKQEMRKEMRREIASAIKNLEDENKLRKMQDPKDHIIGRNESTINMLKKMGTTKYPDSELETTFETVKAFAINSKNDLEEVSRRALKNEIEKFQQDLVGAWEKIQDPIFYPNIRGMIEILVQDTSTSSTPSFEKIQQYQQLHRQFNNLAARILQYEGKTRPG